MNKRQKQIYERYLKSKCYSLYDCYKTFSQLKYKAWNKCISRHLNFLGTNGKIISYNTNIFTYGFIYFTDYGTKCFYYITKNHEEWWEVE